MNNNATSTFYAALEREDRWVDAMLVAIRRRRDAGELTPIGAATERVRILEAHLTAVHDLRVLHGLAPFVVMVDDGEEEGPATCAACGKPVGIFLGHDGWQHFSGAGTAEDPVTIVDAGHVAPAVWGGSW